MAERNVGHLLFVVVNYMLFVAVAVVTEYDELMVTIKLFDCVHYFVSVFGVNDVHYWNSVAIGFGAIDTHVHEVDSPRIY